MRRIIQRHHNYITEKHAVEDITNTTTVTEASGSDTASATSIAAATASTSATPEKTDDTSSKEQVSFKVIYSKEKFEVSFPIDNTVEQLKKHMETLTGNNNEFRHFKVNCIFYFFNLFTITTEDKMFVSSANNTHTISFMYKLD